MSLSSSLSVALRAMLADQGGMDVVSNNIANANTPGYAREVAVFQETPPVEYGNLSFGTGVALTDVQSVRDNILQLRLDQETQNQGKLDTLASGLKAVNPIQLFLDFSLHSGRGEEQANFILTKVLGFHD